MIKIMIKITYKKHDKKTKIKTVIDKKA